MSEFLLPDVMSVEAAGEALIGRLPTTAHLWTQSDRTFYDTFDGLVRAAGLSAVHERGRMTLVDRRSGAERAALTMGRPTAPVLALNIAEGSLRDALLEIIKVRALLPLAHVHCRIRLFEVLDGEQKTVVRLSLEQPTLVASGGRVETLRPRASLAEIRGYGQELERVGRSLEQGLAFKPADQLLVDEAVTAARGVPSGISSKIELRLARRERSDAAAAAVMGRLLEVMEANIDGAIADTDSEFLHDFRVSVRRTRSVQRELKSVFPPAELTHFRAEFRWLQQATGDVRDLDVVVLGFDSLRALVPEPLRPDLDPVLAVLRGRRRLARREMVRALRSERTSTLRRDFAAFLEALLERERDHRPAARRPIEELAGERIRRVYRRMVRMGRAIDRSSPPEAYHELRKKGKELRYLLELFGVRLYPGEVVEPMIKALKRFQDVLGRHQDRQVQIAMLRSLRNEVALLRDGPAALMALGVLVERLRDDERAAREEFAHRFAAFASKEQRQRVKATFP